MLRARAVTYLYGPEGPGVVEADIEVAASFNFTPYLVTALLFLALTVPLARFVDWLVTRDRKRRMAGAR